MIPRFLFVVAWLGASVACSSDTGVAPVHADADADVDTDTDTDTGPCPGVGDTDADGICDDVDACPGFDDEVDTDGDGVADGCDTCAQGDDGVDADADGVPDACDACPGDTDVDLDGICDSDDICLEGDDSIDTDADGVPDACDPCPDDATLQTFNWVTWDTPIVGTSATGNVGGVGITYTSSQPLDTTPDVFSHATFPATFGVPNTDPTIRNSLITSNTLEFSRAVSDPLLVFSSIGSPGTPVSVSFDRPIFVEWHTGLSIVGADHIMGAEGYAVVRVPGVHTSLTFEYQHEEFYVNFVFGFGGTDADTDGDGVPDVCDICPDVPGTPPDGC